jgi:2-dehydropantoate 2-reductase
MTRGAIGENARIVIHGAGSIGCFVGGLLKVGGRRVTFLARPWMAEDIRLNGLMLSDYSGLSARIAGKDLDIQTSPDCLREADLVLLTAKSAATGAAAHEIAALTAPGVPAVSLQNGVANPGILREHLGADRVLAGLVEFNVVYQGGGHFHRGTSGAVAIEAGRADIEHILSVAGLDIVRAEDMPGLQWGKLLFNLNNGLNALSGLPLREQLQCRAWRLLLADQIAEALAVLKAAGIKPAGSQKIPPWMVPPILRLPDALFGIVARPMLRIDPEARSSMWEDLTRGRLTEIDQFQGAILRLAAKHAVRAPVSEAIMSLVRQAEAAKIGPPGLSPAAIEGLARGAASG